MTFPAADAPRLAVALAPVAFDVGTEADYADALAYIAGAEGSAATIAERACDRAGIDFAACPAEILEAAERRAVELMVVPRSELMAEYHALCPQVVVLAKQVAELDKLIATAKKRGSTAAIAKHTAALTAIESEYEAKNKRINRLIALLWP